MKTAAGILLGIMMMPALFGVIGGIFVLKEYFKLAQTDVIIGIVIAGFGLILTVLIAIKMHS